MIKKLIGRRVVAHAQRSIGLVDTIAEALIVDAEEAQAAAEGESAELQEKLVSALGLDIKHSSS